VAGDQGLSAVTQTAAPAPARERTFARRVSGTLHRHPRLRLALLLALPLACLVVAYLGALGVLLLSSLWSTDTFTGQIVHTLTLDNFHRLLTTDVYRTVTLRSIGVAVAVTVICTVVAFPMAFYMAKVASPRARRWLVVAVLTPLWASYLVKAYAWRGMLAGNGVVNWALDPVGLRGPGFGIAATVIVLAYLWLPFMILPIYAGLERLPDSLLEASGDLGASAGRTFRSVVVPLVYPAVVAGSIFTFSLSLGDYIAVQIVGGKNQLIGNLIQTDVGAANDLPLAGALATVPVVIMVAYLLLVRRTGALENL
jgi:putative spermidine/putrescine transport system permease protein